MFSDAVLWAMKRHAIRDYPREACGVVMGDAYYPLANIHADPEHAFECTEQLLPLLAAGCVQALVHSHPNGPDAPTGYDVMQQQAMDVPWGIVPCNDKDALPAFFWHEDFPPPPLLGRRFRFGPSGTDGRGDCGALIHDYFKLQHGLVLREFPRDDRCWHVPGFSYERNLEEAGFHRISPHAVRVGDVFLAQVLCARANHGGVYVGENRIIHHLTNRLSREDSAVQWNSTITGWFRHDGA
jgi:proteasome lid subunit RPN8/RPN11